MIVTMTCVCHYGVKTVTDDCHYGVKTVTDDCHYGLKTVTDDCHYGVKTVTDDCHYGVKTVTDDCHQGALSGAVCGLAFSLWLSVGAYVTKRSTSNWLPQRGVVTSLQTSRQRLWLPRM